MQDLISRQAAIDAIEEYADRLQMVDWKENPGVPYKAYALNWCINTIRDLPSAQLERQWETCFDCPLSHSCPKIRGCTNNEAVEYASSVPNDCPLNRL